MTDNFNALETEDGVQLLEAIKFAIVAHGAISQKRKYTNEPYIVHPIEVVQILALNGCDLVTQMSGALHDVVEDTGVTHQDIHKAFGPQVSHLVSQVTSPEYDATFSRAERHRANLEKLKIACEKAQTIKCADIASNIGTGARSIALLDPTFADLYIQEKMDALDQMPLANPKVKKIALIRIREAMDILETMAIRNPFNRHARIQEPQSS